MGTTAATKEGACCRQLNLRRLGQPSSLAAIITEPVVSIEPTHPFIAWRSIARLAEGPTLSWIARRRPHKHHSPKVPVMDALVNVCPNCIPVGVLPVVPILPKCPKARIVVNRSKAVNRFGFGLIGTSQLVAQS